MPEDSFLWLQLLAEADKISPELFGVLHGFRCMGTRIIQGQTQYVLRPTIDNHLGYESKEKYDEDKLKWLVRWTDEIKQLLKNLHPGGTRPAQVRMFGS
jgi:hypothetical protein